MQEDTTSSFRLSEASGLYESALQAFWDALPPGRVLPLADGRKCEILSPGIRNRGAGPDFHAAIIRIGDSKRTGDVELHRRTSDWLAHGHNQDPAYGNVILHAVDMDDTNPGNAAFLPDVPLLRLPDPPEESPGEKSRTFCKSYFAGRTDEQIRDFARDAGLERMRAKADLLLADMIRFGADRAFREKLLSLLGIPGARDAFSAFALRLRAYDEKTLCDHTDAILWGESGLLPDPAEGALAPDVLGSVRALWNEWWPIRKSGAAQSLAFPRNARPVNSPERRVAMACSILKKLYPDPFPELLRFWNGIHGPEEFPKRMSALFPADEPFWNFHSSFRSKPWDRKCALFGHDRALLLLTDLVVPALHAYVRLTGKNELAQKLEKDYLAIPKSASNRVLKTMTQYCFGGRESLFRTAVEQQGLIHIHRTFCAPLSFHCPQCPLRASIEMKS